MIVDTDALFAAAETQSEGSKTKFLPTATPTCREGAKMRLHQESTTAGWTIAERCGAGRFAEVFRAVSTHNGITRALKCISHTMVRKVVETGSKVLSIDSERNNLLSIGYHPHIAVLHGHFETASSYVLVLEFCAHGNLLEHIFEHGPVLESIACTIFRQLCDALAYVHNKGLVHRDVKPENVLLRTPLRDDCSQVALADFGLSRDYTGGCFTVVGTPAYMAPELLARLPIGTPVPNSSYGTEVDLWACGVSLYVTLAAEPPFDDSWLYAEIMAGSFDFDGYCWKEVSFSCMTFVKHLICDKASRLSASQALDSIWLSRTAV